MSYHTKTLPNTGKGVAAALWILQILIAIVFLAAGIFKLSGNPLMVESFARIGLGQWFRHLTGAIEIASAVMLLVPRLIPVGALLIACTMVGAIAAHLLVLGDSPLVPVVLLFLSVVIFWGSGKRHCTNPRKAVSR